MWRRLFPSPGIHTASGATASIAGLLGVGVAAATEIVGAVVNDNRALERK